MKDICQRFAKKLKIEIDKIYFIYNGSKINEELNFNEQANEEDRKRNIMNVLVNDINDRKEEKIIKSKEVICPICKENILINIYEYKINLLGCKNKHNIKKIFPILKKTIRR